MADSRTIRFLVLSDTHNFQFDETDAKFRQPTPKADVLLHCGDLTQFGDARYYKEALQMLGSIEAELKLVIAGNHDLDLDGKYWQRYCEEGDEDDEDDSDDPAQHVEVLQIMKGPLARQAGVTYLEEGTSTFTLRNGASFKIYTSPYTREFHDMAFPYQRHEDRFNTVQQIGSDDGGTISIAENPIPAGVDIVMTHGPPKGILDRCARSGERLGCENLLRATRRVRPLMHCFGHIHNGYGAEIVDWEEEGQGQQEEEGDSNDSGSSNNGSSSSSSRSSIPSTYPEAIQCAPEPGRQTLAINAAIKNEANQFTNTPWLVDLTVPRTE
ncbi:MAG: hypothetical protein Q9227_002387 [Pyrenula ochraceoflavens]